MGTGILAWMCLALGQSANDVSYYNFRGHRLPVTYQEGRRSETREVLLYESTDQGRNWSLAASIPSTKDSFEYHATKDGIYWLSVAMVNQQGKHDPDELAIKNGPPSLKMVIDTQKPVIRVIQAQRQGDEVYVNWDIQEANPDRDGIRLEYQAKDSPGASWIPIPGASGMNGQAKFRAGNTAPLVVRLTVRDLAKNESFALTEVASSTVTRIGFNPDELNPPKKTEPQITLPVEMKVPSAQDLPKKVDTYVAPPPPVSPPPATTFDPNKILSSGTADLPKPPAGGFVTPPPLASNQNTFIAPPPAQRDPIPMSRIVGDSTKKDPPIATIASGREPSADPMFGSQKTIANAAPARKPLPQLLYVNNHQVTLEYELKKVGPSGIGGVELWLTKDDGVSWEQYAEDKDVQGAPLNGRQKRTFDFRDRVTDQPFPDGIFGLILVVKNRAGIGRQPRPGDAPEIRIEIDKEPPVAQLYEPIPDPQRPDHVLIMWNAVDKNLTQTPIHLEYAENREGPWMPIKLDLENKGRYPGEKRTGDFSWKVPANIPVQVYLRLKVIDKAGNESIAVTDRPQYVDLVEPEGALINASATRRP